MFLSHQEAMAGAFTWTWLCAAVDAGCVRIIRNEDPATSLAPLRISTVLPLALGAAAVAATVPDPRHGLDMAICTGALAIGALRDLRDRVLWPELFLLALGAELVTRTISGNAAEAAIGAGSFGCAATVLVFVLQLLKIPQGMGDVLPAFLLGATFSVTTGLYGISIGFAAYVAFIVLARKLDAENRTVPMGPAFVLTSLAATVLTIHPG
jgi:prepilin signal peptidase PulO-like enzyme (type II secretory pathway)